MPTLKLSLQMPDANHPDMELHLSASDSPLDLVIAVPMNGTTLASPVAGAAVADLAAARRARADDDYVLGGYSGI